MEIDGDGYFVLPTDGLARQQGYYRSEKLPRLLIKFVENFKILSDDFSGEAGRSFKLQAWQRAALMTGYGWRRPDKTLRFRQFSWWLPRRAGKSILSAALCAFHSIKDQRGEIYIIASTKEQAGIIYNYLCSFIESNPDLNRRINTVPSQKRIEDLKTKSTAKVVSVDKVGRSGTSSSLILFDEIHEFPKCYARETWSRLKPSLGSKKNSILINISTAGSDKESLAWDQFKLARDILNGDNHDLHVFPIIYSLDENLDWRDKSLWPSVLPQKGITVADAFYDEEFEKALASPIEEVSFRRQYLNQWTGSPEIWIPTDIVERNYEEFREEDFYGCEAVLGIDYGASYDLTSWVYVIKKEDKFYVLPRFAIPREKAKKDQMEIGTPYLSWASRPECNFYLTDGDTVDGTFLINKIKDEQKKFRVRKCYYDRTRLEIIRQQIAGLGIETIDHGTSTSAMSPGFQRLERLFRENKIRWNNTVFRWNLENARPVVDKNDNLMIRKVSDHQKIDAIDATAMALAFWIDDDTAATQLPPGQSWITIV